MPSPVPSPALTEFATRQLPAAPDVVAPDGSDVRVLLRTANGSMAHFELAAGRASDPIRHRTVEEIWYVLAGTGEIWRKQGEREEIVPLVSGTCITIPRGAHFQFRASAAAALSAIGITMPPWPGADEAIAVAGIWRPG